MLPGRQTPPLRANSLCWHEVGEGESSGCVVGSLFCGLVQIRRRPACLPACFAGWLAGWLLVGWSASIFFLFHSTWTVELRLYRKPFGEYIFFLSCLRLFKNSFLLLLLRCVVYMLHNYTLKWSRLFGQIWWSGYVPFDCTRSIFLWFVQLSRLKLL